MTDELYGHVVASDVFGNSYVVPIFDLFDDITNRLSAHSVSLPSVSDIFMLNESFFRLKPTSSIEPLVDHVSPVPIEGRGNAGPPSQTSHIPEYRRESYSPSGLWKCPSPFPPYIASDYIGNSCNLTFQPDNEGDIEGLYRYRDSGYTSLNTTPEGPGIGFPLLETAEFNRGSKVVVGSDNSKPVMTKTPGAVVKYIDQSRIQ